MNYLKVLITAVKKSVKETMLSDPYYAVQFYRKKGVTIGEHVRLYNVLIDARRPFLLEIGDNVIMTNCRVLTHDASTSIASGYTKIGRVKIGSNVFVGVGAIILPNVKIGDNVIIGAGTVVAKDVPSNSVVVGSPQRVISSFESFVQKNEALMQNRPLFRSGILNAEEINSMNQILQDGIGYVESADSIHLTGRLSHLESGYTER